MIVAVDPVAVCPTCDTPVNPGSTTCECGERLQPHAPDDCNCGGRGVCTVCVLEELTR